MRRHRSAADGRFVSAEAAAADPERHVMQTIRPAPEMRAEWMNGHFLKIHLGDGRVLHHFSGADGPDADYHDHPFPADIRIVAGGYVEQLLSPDGSVQEVERRTDDCFRNEAGTVHRIIHLTAPFVITEFKPGPHERKPGFYRFAGGQMLHRFWDQSDFKPLA